MPSYAPFYDPKAKHFEKDSVAELTKAYIWFLICPSLIDFHMTVCSTARTYSWHVTLVLGKPLLAAKISRLNWPIRSRYLTAATIFRGDISSREVSASGNPIKEHDDIRPFLPRLKYVPLWPCFFLFVACSMWPVQWLVVLLGRSAWPPDKKLATLRGVGLPSFEWVEQMLTCFLEGGFLTMCLFHLSESLLLDRLRYTIILSSTYRNQPLFSLTLFSVRYCPCQLNFHSGTF